MIAVGSVTHFLRMMQERYHLNAEDRIAATSDITFDISFFNMFMAWKAGASLHVVPATQLMAPAKFIQEKQITVWFSVPSIAAFMRRMKLLTPGAFPSLRYSLFAGEPLPLNSALAWQEAAAGSTVLAAESAGTNCAVGLASIARLFRAAGTDQPTVPHHYRQEMLSDR
jgi:non-ribosomal peptide synthetase component F